MIRRKRNSVLRAAAPALASLAFAFWAPGAQAGPPMPPVPPPTVPSPRPPAPSKAPAAGGAPAAVAKSSSSAVDAEASALFATPLSINEVYNGSGLRDPFVSLLGSSQEEPADTSLPPSIHNLSLRGVITGNRERLALLEDTTTGLRYVLRSNGRLYNSKDKPVPGIEGSIKSTSNVLVTTPADKDVQWLRLGDGGASN